MALRETQASSINYWKGRSWSSVEFCGQSDQQANENKIWLQIFNDLDYGNVETQKMNFLDLCSGWGRLIFFVALRSKIEFQSYEGIDINFSCKYIFLALARLSREHIKRNFEVEFTQRNLLDFQYGKKYGLVTASWALGFFDENQIKSILDWIA